MRIRSPPGAKRFNRFSGPERTWSGLRGGISIALALALPESEYRQIILASVYGVVLFTILVQGLTLERVADYFFRRKQEA